MRHSERPFPIPKDVLDTVNSLSWFLMDAAWMLEAQTTCLVLVVPTMASALMLVYVEKGISLTFINLAVLAWIGMNVSWMMSDLQNEPSYLLLTKICFGLGIVFVSCSLALSQNISETFSHFKRFRMKKLRRTN